MDRTFWYGGNFPSQKAKPLTSEVLYAVRPRNDGSKSSATPRHQRVYFQDNVDKDRDADEFCF